MILPRWLRLSAVALAAMSGTTAMATVSLPPLLVLLMLLFDSAAHGLMVLLGLVAAWLSTLLPAPKPLPGYGGLVLHPGPVMLAALLPEMPLIAGLLVLLHRPRPGVHNGISTCCWLLAALLGGGTVALLLLPGLSALALLTISRACPPDQGISSRCSRSDPAR